MPDTTATIELSGSVENITFRREDNGFTVLDILSDDELVTVVGILPQVSVGEQLRLQGYWDHHNSFGRQFRALLCEHSLPATSADLLKYLSSGIVKGVGPATALKIVEAFGDSAFEVLENQPARLASIKGISGAKAEGICKEFKAQFAMRQVIIALERYRMSPTECINAYKIFGNNAVDAIRQNPYVLCNEGIGIGFERADAIAESIPEFSEPGHRVSAGILHVVRHNLANGHTCLPREKLYDPCKLLLDASTDVLDAALESLIANGQLVRYQIVGREFLFLPHIYRAEKRAADFVFTMLRFPPAGRDTLDKDIKKVEKTRGIKFEEKQRLAIVTAVQKGLLILTGGPGTGKTTTINGILSLFEFGGLDVALTAPTGRAAKRMSEVTDRPAKTIHRLLEVEWDQNDKPVFNRNARNPLKENAVIVDELSMVDISLFAALMEALPIGCRLIMVGDADQLPPVGAGNVLHDLIASGLIPVVELKEIFRQAMESQIVLNAHKIVRGEMPQLDVRDKDFFFIDKPLPYQAAKLIGELCSERLPAAYGLSPITDIQVLSPTKKGDTGTVNLNNRLQALINPSAKIKKEMLVHGITLREGDKVMQIKNNYNIVWEKDGEEGTGIFNGDVGVLQKIDTDADRLEVVFDDRLALYTLDQAVDLELAYAVTVHKSQGSEFAAVVMPVAGVAPQLAYRNLLYTAVTRARQLMIIVGNEHQIRYMVENDKKSKRYSALRAFLVDGTS